MAPKEVKSKREKGKKESVSNEPPCRIGRKFAANKFAAGY
jgi:hypothetical protein